MYNIRATRSWRYLMVASDQNPRSTGAADVASLGGSGERDGGHQIRRRSVDKADNLFRTRKNRRLERRPTKVVNWAIITSRGIFCSGNGRCWTPNQHKYSRSYWLLFFLCGEPLIGIRLPVGPTGDDVWFSPSKSIVFSLTTHFWMCVCVCVCLEFHFFVLCCCPFWASGWSWALQRSN